jgi:hypothetical protein
VTAPSDRIGDRDNALLSGVRAVLDGADDALLVGPRAGGKFSSSRP